MNNLADIMRAVAEISSNDIELVKQYAAVESHPKRHKLLTQGRVCCDLFIVSSGVVRYYGCNDETEHTVAFGSEGDPIASMTGLFNNSPSEISVESITPIEVYHVSSQALQVLIATSRGVLYWLYKYVCGQSGAFARKMMFYSGYDSYTRYKMFLEARPELVGRIPVHLLADYLLMSRETLSRCRHRYIRDSKK